MFPLRDTVRAYSFPIINILLILINALIFFFENGLPAPVFNRLILTFGIVPARLHLTSPQMLIDNPEPLITLLTHMFLHSGWLHFLSNIWILFIFGDGVEDRMGSGRYLLFYLASGLVAGLLQAIVTPTSRIPAIGASGAIAGVLGAYFVLYPRARVVTFIPIFIIPWLVEIPALIYLGFWFITQIFSGLSSLSLSQAANTSGVAWWAHTGGFLFGLLFYRQFTPAIHPAYWRRFPDDFT